jgi:hypothetical protein
MAARFELWDAESGNALGDYATEDGALAVIREAIRHDSRASVATLGLLCVNARGRATVIAEGDELAARALAAAPSEAATVLA